MCIPPQRHTVVGVLYAHLGSRVMFLCLGGEVGGQALIMRESNSTVGLFLSLFVSECAVADMEW